jgi:hypothetical protein
MVPTIIFSSASLLTIHASKCHSHTLWTVENELVVLSRRHRCRLVRICGIYTAWKMSKWGYLSHRVPSVSAIIDIKGNRVNPVCVFKEFNLLKLYRLVWQTILNMLQVFCYDWAENMKLHWKYSIDTVVHFHLFVWKKLTHNDLIQISRFWAKYC